MKRLLSLLLLCCTATGLWAADDYDFTVDLTQSGGSATLYCQIISEEQRTVRTVNRANYWPEGTDIEIPQTVSHDEKYYTITEIGESSFYGWKFTNSISLPSTVVSIGTSAFGYCHAQTINLGSGVQSIGATAFFHSSAKTVNLGTSLKSIGANAFEQSAIESINLPEGLTTLSLYTFWNCASLESVVLPSTLETIPQWCFSGCTALENVTLPPTLKTIGSEAFHKCSSLTEITIPASVTSFGAQNGAFKGCSGLQTIIFEWTEIPSGITLSYEFDSGTLSSATIVVPKGCESAYSTALGSSAHIVSPTNNQTFTNTIDGLEMTFKITDDEALECMVGDGEHVAIDATSEVYTGTRRIALPATATFAGKTFTVTEVGAYAFEDIGLEGIVFPSSIVKIGDYAFYKGNFGSVNLGYVRTIGNYAFAGASENVKGLLTTVSFVAPEGARMSSSATYADGDVFAYNADGNVRAPKRVNGESSVLSIGEHSFEHNNISNLDLGNMESAGDYAFYNNQLETVNTQNLKYLGKECFGKNPIKNIIIGDGLSSISDESTTVTTGDGPFGKGLTGVTSVLAGSTIPAIATALFGSCPEGVFIAGAVVVATSVVVWAFLRGKRANFTDEDKAKNEDKFVFTLQKNTAKKGTSITYTIEMPTGVKYELTSNPSGPEFRSGNVIYLPVGGLFDISAIFSNKWGYHYKVPTITIPLKVEDDEPAEEPEPKPKSMVFDEHEVTMVRGQSSYDVTLTYTNISPAEAANVIFSLNLTKWDEEIDALHFIDENLISMISVEKKIDAKGYPCARLTVSKSPLTAKAMLGLGRYLTAELTTDQGLLTDRAIVTCLSFPNPENALFRDTVQVGDVIALPEFNDFFPTCYALTPFYLNYQSGGGIATRLGYARYSKKIIKDNQVCHRAVPLISYIDETGFPITGGGMTAHSPFEMQTTVKLIDEAKNIYEEQVDTIVIRAKSAGLTRLRFSDPYFTNIYFDMEVISVDPATTPATANPYKWDFTKPVDKEHYMDGYDDSLLDELETLETFFTRNSRNTMPYWRKTAKDEAKGIEGYYSSDVGYYPRQWGDKDTRKWAPFYSNTGRNLPQFEGITASIVADGTDWHKPIDRIRIYDNRAEGEAQVAFVGQTDLCIKKPMTLTGYTDTHKVPFIVKGNMLKDAEVTCSYTYNDGSAQNYSQTRSFSAAANDETLEFELDDRMTTDITLSVNNVELEYILIKAPLPDVTDHGIRYTYSLSGNGYEASGFDKDDADANGLASDGKYSLTLAESLTVDETDYPVTAIADGAFTDSRLSSIHIPHTDPSALAVGNNAIASGVVRYVPMASLKAYVLDKPLWANDLFTDYTIPSAGIGAPALDAPVYVSSTDNQASVWIIKDNATKNESDDYVVRPVKVSDNVANANEGILIRGTAGSTVSMKFQTEDSKFDYIGNLLKANITAQHIDNSAGNCYGMSKGEFWLLPDEGVFPANRSYLQLPAAIGAARSLVIDWSDDEYQGIKDIDGSRLDNAAWYKLDGSRLNTLPTQRGIYINNGNKVVIK